MKRIAIILATALAWEAGAFALLPAEGDLNPAQTAVMVGTFVLVACTNLCVACYPSKPSS